MADDPRSVREVNLVIEGVSARLDKAIDGVSARLDLAISGIDKRLVLMTAVFAICVGLGAVAFWNLDAKIDKAIATLSDIKSADQSTKVAAKLFDISDQLSGLKRVLKSTSSNDNEKQIVATILSDQQRKNFFQVLKENPPPPNDEMFVVRFEDGKEIVLTGSKLLSLEEVMKQGSHKFAQIIARKDKGYLENISDIAYFMDATAKARPE